MTTVETFDFGDSKGPVPGHRHPNGGGWVAETAYVAPTAYVGPDAGVYGNGLVYGNGRVAGNGLVYGNGRVYGNGLVYGNGQVYGNGRVYGNGQVSGNGLVYGNGLVSGDGLVSAPTDCATIGPVGSRGATLTLHRDAVTGHRYNTGCFSGTFTDLKAACLKTHDPDSPHYRNYGAAAVALWRIVMGDTPLPTEGTP